MSPARCSQFGNVALDIALAALRGQMTLHQLANVRLASLASCAFAEVGRWTAVSQGKLFSLPSA